MEKEREGQERRGRERLREGERENNQSNVNMVGVSSLNIGH